MVLVAHYYETNRQITTMRSFWQQHVKKTQQKLNRRKKKDENKVGWREAMKVASISWPKEKAKIERKRKREAKKIVKDSCEKEESC